MEEARTGDLFSDVHRAGDEEREGEDDATAEDFLEGDGDSTGIEAGGSDGDDNGPAAAVDFAGDFAGDLFTFAFAAFAGEDDGEGLEPADCRIGEFRKDSLARSARILAALTATSASANARSASSA